MSSAFTNRMHMVGYSLLSTVNLLENAQMEIFKTEELNPDLFPEHNPIDLHTEEGDRIYTYRWTTLVQPPLGVILFYHGYSSFGGKYSTVAKRFVDRGYDYLTLDVNGHGQSEGLHGYIASVESLLAVCKKFALVAKGMYPKGTHFHALGNSMGGAIAISLALDEPDLFKSLLLVAPFLRTCEPVSGVCLL